MKERKRFTEQSQGYFDFMMRYFYLTRQLMCGRYIFNFNSVTLEGRKPDHGHFPWKCGCFRKVPTCKCANSLAQYCDSMFGHSEFRVVHSGSTLRDLARLVGGDFVAQSATKQWWRGGRRKPRAPCVTSFQCGFLNRYTLQILIHSSNTNSEARCKKKLLFKKTAWILS